MQTCLELVPSHGVASHGLVRTAVRQDVSAERVCAVCMCGQQPGFTSSIWKCDYGGVGWGGVETVFS